MSAPAIESMSWEGKLRTLEELWDSITRWGDRCESPAWHEQELKETPGPRRARRREVNGLIWPSWVKCGTRHPRSLAHMALVGQGPGQFLHRMGNATRSSLRRRWITLIVRRETRVVKEGTFGSCG